MFWDIFTSYSWHLCMVIINHFHCCVILHCVTIQFSYLFYWPFRCFHSLLLETVILFYTCPWYTCVRICITRGGIVGSENVNGYLMVLSCIPLITNEMECLFLFLFTICLFQFSFCEIHLFIFSFNFAVLLKKYYCVGFLYSWF